MLKNGPHRNFTQFLNTININLLFYKTDNPSSFKKHLNIPSSLLLGYRLAKHLIQLHAIRESLLLKLSKIIYLILSIGNKYLLTLSVTITFYNFSFGSTNLTKEIKKSQGYN